MVRFGLGVAALTVLVGCATEGSNDQLPFRPEYQGIETRLLAEDLVNFQVRMAGAQTDQDVADYADCAAAQYALIRGYGFARHVRTTVTVEGGIHAADAVYTVSPALPRGLKTIDAEVKVADCGERGIPTV